MITVYPLNMHKVIILQNNLKIGFQGKRESIKLEAVYAGKK